MNNQWETIVEKLRNKLDAGSHKVWIAPLSAEIKDGTLVLTASSAYMARWIQDRLLGTITECAREVLGDKIRVCVESKKEEIAVVRVKPSKEEAWLPVSLPKMTQKTYTWRHSFEDFVEGSSNRMALAAAKDVCLKNGDVQTLYVNAQSGLGKTHLAQSVGYNISTHLASERVGYMTAEEFSSRYVMSLKMNEVQSFKDEMRQLDVLLFEDVHFLQNKPKIQETVLTVVKNIQEHGGRVVFTSSFSPRELQKVDSQLVSSFCSGILAHIDQPDQAMRAEIIRSKAHSLKMKISDAVCELLAQRLTSDVRQIESCLNSLIFKAKVMHCEMTPEMAIDVLSEYTDSVSPTDIDSLTRLVCENLGIELANVYSPSRCRANVIGRNTIFYLARKYTDLTLKQIGQPFNKRHSSVLQGITAVERELSKQSTLGRQIERTIAIVNKSLGRA